MPEVTCGCSCRAGPAEPSPIYLGLSRGLCRECGTAGRKLVDARYVSDGSSVYLERVCPEHGTSRALVAESLTWYLDVLRAPAAARPPAKVLPRQAAGCPGSCGPCAFHAQRCNLPVFSITNVCDLRCPICFTFNRADRQYFMSAEEFERQVDFVVRATGGVDLIDITGGEPTLHPELPDLLQLARRPEIGRVAVNSNGLRLARDPELARRLGELGVYVILSLDTLDPEQSRTLHGADIVDAKRRALDNLARFDVQTTLLMVLAGGVNENQLGPLLELTLGREHIRSLTVQTMTYTGQGGGSFGPRWHIPVDSVERMIEQASGGRVRQADFMPLPTAHPLCYGVTYLLAGGAGVHPFVDLLDRATIARHLADGYLLQPTGALEVDLHRAVDRLWSEGRHPELLEAIRDLLRTLYPTGGPALSVHERQRLAERRVKTIYVHAHMDEDTYEVGRAIRCPDQVPLADEEKLVGACNYNLFFRMHDERFWVAP